MSLQFKRRVRVSFYNDAGEGLVVEELRIRFRLTKTLLGYPTRGELEIFNLSEANIQRITSRLTTVRVEVAYAAEPFTEIFLSNIMNFYKTREGVDSIFAVILSGAGIAFEGSTFSRTYREGVPPANILRDVAGSFEGVAVGVLLDSEEWQPKLSSVTHSGGVREIMNKLAIDYNFDWAVTEGRLDIIPRNKVLTDKEVYLVTPDTGLIGAPTLTELGADFRVLLNPKLALGRQIDMKVLSAQLGQEGLEFRKVRNTADGSYKMMDLRYLGDNRGNDWYCDIIGWRIGNAPKR